LVLAVVAVPRPVVVGAEFVVYEGSHEPLGVGDHHTLNPIGGLHGSSRHSHQAPSIYGFVGTFD
jgi:hypothetical protein